MMDGVRKKTTAAATAGQNGHYYYFGIFIFIFRLIRVLIDCPDAGRRAGRPFTDTARSPDRASPSQPSSPRARDAYGPSSKRRRAIQRRRGR